jgi:hypothetical protein
MADINSTNINDLPTDPTNGGSVGGNISLVTNELQGTNNTVISQQPIGPGPGAGAGPGLSLDQSTISQIVNGLQQASLTGATQLPSRDISLNTDNLTNDVQIQPNYIPAPREREYIIESDDDINAYYKNEKMENSLDSVYDELQGPILLAVLYFLFQLPFLKKLIFKHLSFCCHKDGNYNINGLILTCGLFGLVYYSLSKTVKHFSKF